MSKISKIHQRVNTPAAERPINMGQPVQNSNTFWDDAENLYRTCMGAINKSHGQLAEYLSAIVADPDFEKKVEDMPGLLLNINLLNKDIAEHIARLEEIHARHAGRTGSTTGPTDNMHLIQIHGLYADQVTIYEQNIMPTVSHIFEQCGATQELLDAERAEKARLAAEAEVDISVITDVAVKEVPVITAEQHAEALRIDQDNK